MRTGPRPCRDTWRSATGGDARAGGRGWRARCGHRPRDRHSMAAKAIAIAAPTRRRAPRPSRASATVPGEARRGSDERRPRHRARAIDARDGDAAHRRRPRAVDEAQTRPRRGAAAADRTRGTREPGVRHEAEGPRPALRGGPRGARTRGRRTAARPRRPIAAPAQITNGTWLVAAIGRRPPRRRAPRTRRRAPRTCRGAPRRARRPARRSPPRRRSGARGRGRGGDEQREAGNDDFAMPR